VGASGAAGCFDSAQHDNLPMNWEAIALTLKLATITCLVLLVVGLPIAYWLAFTKWRWRFLVESVVALPLVLPPTVLGFYLLLAMGPNGPLGAWFGLRLPFTFEGLLIASVIYSLPFTVQPAAAAFQAVDWRAIEAAQVAGAAPVRAFLQMVIPLAGGGVLTAVVLSFAHTMGEFGVVLMVGGNIQGVTRTASIDVYDKVQMLDYTAAGETALFLLVTSYALLTAVYGLNRGLFKVWPQR